MFWFGTIEFQFNDKKKINDYGLKICTPHKTSQLLFLSTSVQRKLQRFEISLLDLYGTSYIGIMLNARLEF
jgi:hypothetical protein